jgi:RNA polymerase sigma-70 factor (ECF subfamily)
VDPRRVEELYRLYGYAVHRRCLRLLRTQAAADDALQEVFVRVLRYGASFDEREPLSWLYRIAQNVCFDRIAHERRLRETSPEAGESAAEPEADARPDERQLLLELLASAQPSEQSAALLYYFDGLTQAEIAVELGCSREAVTQRLGRFRDEAKKLLLRGAVP